MKNKILATIYLMIMGYEIYKYNEYLKTEKIDKQEVKRLYTNMILFNLAYALEHFKKGVN